MQHDEDEDQEVIKPDQGTLSTQIHDLFQENQEISYNENLTDPVLDSIPQKFTTREETGKPQII